MAEVVKRATEESQATGKLVAMQRLELEAAKSKLLSAENRNIRLEERERKGEALTASAREELAQAKAQITKLDAFRGAGKVLQETQLKLTEALKEKDELRGMIAEAQARFETALSEKAAWVEAMLAGEQAKLESSREELVGRALESQKDSLTELHDRETAQIETKHHQQEEDAAQALEAVIREKDALVEEKDALTREREGLQGELYDLSSHQGSHHNELQSMAANRQEELQSATVNLQAEYAALKEQNQAAIVTQIEMASEKASFSLQAMHAAAASRSHDEAETALRAAETRFQLEKEDHTTELRAMQTEFQKRRIALETERKRVDTVTEENTARSHQLQEWQSELLEQEKSRARQDAEGKSIEVELRVQLHRVEAELGAEIASRERVERTLTDKGMRLDAELDIAKGMARETKRVLDAAVRSHAVELERLHQEAISVRGELQCALQASAVAKAAADGKHQRRVDQAEARHDAWRAELVLAEERHRETSSLHREETCRLSATISMLEVDLTSAYKELAAVGEGEGVEALQALLMRERERRVALEASMQRQADAWEEEAASLGREGRLWRERALAGELLAGTVSPPPASKGGFDTQQGVDNNRGGYTVRNNRNQHRTIAVVVEEEEEEEEGSRLLATPGSWTVEASSSQARVAEGTPSTPPTAGTSLLHEANEQGMVVIHELREVLSGLQQARQRRGGGTRIGNEEQAHLLTRAAAAVVGHHRTAPPG